jgi:hypothetical protein
VATSTAPAGGKKSSTCRRAAEKIGLAFDRRRAGARLIEIEEGADAAHRVGERHHRAAVNLAAERAMFRRDAHLRDDLVALGADEIDSEVIGERQPVGANAFERRHGELPQH